MTQIADGRYLAVGSALEGARRGAGLWSSPDGVKWQPYGSVPTGTPTLWTVTQMTDGSLLACGSVGPADPPTVGCWSQPAGAYGQASWRRYDLTPAPGSPVPLSVYDVVGTARGLFVAGTGRDEGGRVDATAWSMQVQVR